MEEKLISFETAKLAKEKEFGYDFGGTHYTPSFYCEGDNIITLSESEMQQEDACRCDYYLLPTQSLLQQWLREEHNIMVSVITAYSGGFISEKLVKSFKPSIEIINVIGKNIFTNDLKYEMFHGLEPMSYDEALELGLLEGLKLITKIK